MHPPTNRREFFRHAAFGSAALLGAGLAARVPAAEPIARNGTAKFKFSLAAYSYRNLLSGNEPQLTLEDFINDCAAMGLEGTELTSYYFPKQPTGEYIRGLKSAAFRLGLDVSGTAVGNDFCHPPGEQREQQIGHVKQWINYAEILGAPVIRIFSGKARSGQSAEEAHKLAVAAIEECCEYAGQHGVFLALENHGGLTQEIDGLLQLVRDVNSPWFGINLDTGNFQGTSSQEQAYTEMARMAPYALNVQVKVKIALKGRGKVDSDFKRLARILTDSGYRGYIVLEYEEGEDPRKACPRFVDELRKSFG